MASKGNITHASAKQRQSSESAAYEYFCKASEVRPPIAPGEASEQLDHAEVRNEAMAKEYWEYTMLALLVRYSKHRTRTASRKSRHKHREYFEGGRVVRRKQDKAPETLRAVKGFLILRTLPQHLPRLQLLCELVLHAIVVWTHAVLIPSKLLLGSNSPVVHQAIAIPVAAK